MLPTHATIEGSQHENDESMSETCSLKTVRDDWTPYRVSDRECTSNDDVHGLAILLGAHIPFSCN
jgi:hypothetical protein